MLTEGFDLVFPLSVELALQFAFLLCWDKNTLDAVLFFHLDAL